MLRLAVARPLLMIVRLSILYSLLWLLPGCSRSASKAGNMDEHIIDTATTVIADTVAGNGDKKNVAGEVPVLCYHQVRNRRDDDSKNSRPYIIPAERFGEHMKMLHDSGYHTILPEELTSYLEDGKPLPAKAIMLTFDDGTISQYEQALPVLDKYHFKAVFFIMTVTLDKPATCRGSR